MRETWPQHGFAPFTGDAAREMMDCCDRDYTAPHSPYVNRDLAGNHQENKTKLVGAIQAEDALAQQNQPQPACVARQMTVREKWPQHGFAPYRCFAAAQRATRPFAGDAAREMMVCCDCGYTAPHSPYIDRDFVQPILFFTVSRFRMVVLLMA